MTADIVMNEVTSTDDCYQDLYNLWVRYLYVVILLANTDVIASEASELCPEGYTAPGKNHANDQPQWNQRYFELQDTRLTNPFCP